MNALELRATEFYCETISGKRLARRCLRPTRNVERHVIRSAAGQFWAADVGQNLWEEVELIVKGGNYG